MTKKIPGNVRGGFFMSFLCRNNILQKMQNRLHNRRPSQIMICPRFPTASLKFRSRLVVVVNTTSTHRRTRLGCGGCGNPLQYTLMTVL